jgi:hypothetical protein
MAESKSDRLARLASVALAGLAAKVEAPPFPGDGASSEDVQSWIVDIMRRVGDRIATPKDIEFLRYLAGNYDSPAEYFTQRQIIGIADRLEGKTNASPENRAHS